jgi:hypothetical protein
MLSGVDDDFLKLRMCPERSADDRSFDKLRAGPDDGKDFCRI